MTHSFIISSPARRLAASGILSWTTPLRGVFTWLAGLQKRAEQRRRLRQLDDWQLRDIGVTREECLREARKPFWIH